MGSVEAARRAGRRLAVRAAKMRIVATSARVSAARLVEPMGGEFAEGCAQGEAEEQAGGYAGCRGGEDEAEEVAGFCAESDADAEFVGTRGDGVRDDTVEADDSESEREKREDAE